MGFFLSRRWKRQPQGPVEVDWSNPLADGLGGLITFSGGRWRELTRALPVDPQWSENGVSPAGRASTGLEPQAGNPTGIVCTNGDAQYAGTDPDASLFAFGYLHPSGTDPGGNQDAGHVNRAQLRISRPGFNATNVVEFNCTTTDFQYPQVAPGAILTFGRAFSVGVTRKPGTAGMRGFAYGALCGTTDGGSGSVRGDANVSAWNFSINLRSNGGSGFAVALGVNWRRALQDAEHAALNDNPWQLIRPRTLRIYSLPASGPTTPRTLASMGCGR